MNKKKFPEGFFTKDRPIAKPKYLNAEDMLNNYEADCEVYENSVDLLDTELWMIDYLKNHSSADVQPVVHCKDWFWYNKKTNCCTFLGNEQFDEDEYCSKCNEIQGNMDGDEHEN